MISLIWLGWSKELWPRSLCHVGKGGFLRRAGGLGLVSVHCVTPVFTMPKLQMAPAVLGVLIWTSGDWEGVISRFNGTLSVWLWRTCVWLPVHFFFVSRSTNISIYCQIDTCFLKEFERTPPQKRDPRVSRLNCSGIKIENEKSKIFAEELRIWASKKQLLKGKPL